MKALLDCECVYWARTDTGDFLGHHPNCSYYETIKVYKITPGEGLNPCCEKDPQMVLQWLEEAEVGDKIKIEVLLMTQDVYRALPEYAGP